MDLYSSYLQYRSGSSTGNTDFKMNSILEKLSTTFLYGNKYIVSLVPVGYLTQGIFNANIAMMMNTVELPTVSFNTKEIYTGGYSSNHVVGIDQGELNFTMYNTGSEYDAFSYWSNIQYNPKTKSYAFPDDTTIDIHIIEYNIAHQRVLTHSFFACHLVSYGNISLSYEEATQVQTFSASVGYEEYKVSI